MSDIQETRRRNLELLIKEYGSIIALSEAVGKSQSQISNLKNGVRNIGEKLARHIEDSLGIKKGYLDQEFSENCDALESYFNNIRKHFEKFHLSVEELRLMKDYRNLTDKDQAIVKSLIQTLKEKNA